MGKKQNSDLASWIVSVIRDFIEKSPENTLQNKANDRAFDTPLVGFSRGDDPIYLRYKESVGTCHWTPLEIFSLTFPEHPAKAEDLTVISWVLPQMEATKADNRKETMFPSER
jgi:epoxyqueuosine reductase